MPGTITPKSWRFINFALIGAILFGSTAATAVNTGNQTETATTVTAAAHAVTAGGPACTNCWG